MNLYLFPESANRNNGYGVAVERDYLRIHPAEDDFIVWYTILENKDIGYKKNKDIIIKKNRMMSVKSICNVIAGKDRTELLIKELSFLQGMSFDKIFCGDTIFYNAIRALFPDNYLHVRFHNCFARIYDRKQLLGQKLDWKFNMKLENMYKLERKIFNDANTYKIFISDEDREYYTSMYGKKNDSETWMMNVDLELMKNSRRPIKIDHTITWFGGVESHKLASLRWFIKDIFPVVQKAVPDVEFHLWGRGTEKFSSQNKGIFAHGFFTGNGIPDNNAIFINPDLIGGGVKIKLLTLIENGIPFISTPFGFEGYSENLIDGKYIIVVEEQHWADKIIEIIQGKDVIMPN